jgi:hypothetical protein
VSAVRKYRDLLLPDCFGCAMNVLLLLGPASTSSYLEALHVAEASAYAYNVSDASGEQHVIMVLAL